MAVLDPAFERQREHILLEGDLPSPADPVRGPQFQHSLSGGDGYLLLVEPEFEQVSVGHWVASHRR